MLHLVVVLSMLLALVASAATMGSLLRQHTESAIIGAEHQVDAQNLFTYADITLFEEVQKIFLAAQSEKLDSQGDITPAPDEPMSEEQKVARIRLFWEKLDELEGGFEQAFLQNQAVISSGTQLHILRCKVEFGYFDKGKKYFVMGNKAPASWLSSSEEMAVRLEIRAKNRWGHRMSYAKYYYFHMDQKMALQQPMESKDLVSGEIYYVREY